MQTAVGVQGVIENDKAHCTDVRRDLKEICLDDAHSRSSVLCWGSCKAGLEASGADRTFAGHATPLEARCRLRAAFQADSRHEDGMVCLLVSAEMTCCPINTLREWLRVFLQFQLFCVMQGCVRWGSMEATLTRASWRACLPGRLGGACLYAGFWRVALAWPHFDISPSDQRLGLLGRDACQPNVLQSLALLDRPYFDRMWPI